MKHARTTLALAALLAALAACSASPPPSCSGPSFALNAGQWTPPTELAGR